MEQRRYLRHKKTGVIFSYHEGLAAHPDLVEVNEQTAFPQRFAPKGALERESKVDISIPKEIVDLPSSTPPELASDGIKRSQLFGPSVPGPKAPRAKAKMAEAGLAKEI